MPYVVAAVAAALSLLGEMHWQQRYWFTFPAAGWWALRVGVEITVALIATAAIRRVPTNVLQINGVLLGAIAGLAAPRSVGRTEVVVKGRDFNPVHLAYSRAVRDVDEQIDQHSAEVQRIYADEVILPAAEAQRLRLGDIEKAFRQHVLGRRGFSPAERAERLKFIAETVNDRESSTPEKVTTLFFKAWEIGASRSFDAFTKGLPRRRYLGATAFNWLLAVIRIKR